MDPMIASEIAACQGNLALVYSQFHSQRPMPEGMFQVFPEIQEVRCAEAVILIAAQHPVSVDVRAAKRRLEVERDVSTATREGQRGESPDPERSLHAP